MSSTETNRTKGVARWICFGGMTLIAISSIVFCWVVYGLVGVAMYDSNADTFQHTLSFEQRMGIIRSAKGILAPAIMLLTITNLAWIVGVGISLVRSRNRQEEDSKPDAV